MTETDIIDEVISLRLGFNGFSGYDPGNVTGQVVA